MPMVGNFITTKFKLTSKEQVFPETLDSASAMVESMFCEKFSRDKYFYASKKAGEKLHND